MRKFFRNSIITKNVAISSSWDFISVFRYFSYYASMLSNPFYQILIISDFIRKVIAFFNNWSFLMKKDIHLVPSKLFAYPLVFSSIILNALLNFIIFVSNEVFKIFFPLGNLGRYHYIINIHIVYFNWAYI